MGLIGTQIAAALPNATKCSSWQNIQASHISTEHAPLTMKAFFGGLSLMALGLGASLIGFCAENITFIYRKHADKRKPKGQVEEYFVPIFGKLYWRRQVARPSRKRQVRRNRLVDTSPSMQINKIGKPTNGRAAGELLTPPPDMAIYRSPF